MQPAGRFLVESTIDGRIADWVVITMRSPLLTLILLTLLPAWTSPANASEIYQWTDEDGVVHFSDTEPEHEVAADTLYIRDTNPPGYDPARDPYSVRNQAERIKATWAEFAEAREEREERRREAAERNRSLAPAPYDPYRNYYRPAYFSSIHTVPPRRNQQKLVRRQLHALEELGLTGPRPQSINSGAHHARIQKSRNLPIVTAKPGPRRKMPHR